MESQPTKNLQDANKGTPLDATAFVKALNLNNVDKASEIITIVKYNGGAPTTER